MSSGVYGKGLIDGNSLNKLIKITNAPVPAGMVQTVSIRVCNTNGGGEAATVELFIATDPGDGSTTAIGPTDYYTTPQLVSTAGPMEETGVVVGAGESIYIRSDSAGVSYRVAGFEQGA